MGASICVIGSGSPPSVVPRFSASARPSMMGSITARHPSPVSSSHAARVTARAGRPVSTNVVCCESQLCATRSTSTTAARSSAVSAGSAPDCAASCLAAVIVVRQAASGSRSAFVRPNIMPPPDCCRRCTCAISCSRSMFSGSPRPICSSILRSCSKSNGPKGLGLDIE